MHFLLREHVYDHCHRYLSPRGSKIGVKFSYAAIDLVFYFVLKKHSALTIPNKVLVDVICQSL